MDIAENLYQKGLTSYPRTDNSVYPPSINLIEILNKLASVQALRDSVNSVLSQKEIVPSKGKETKDHPPIYPVGVAQKENLSQDEWKIYELICRRFLATLSEDARTENTSVLLSANEEPYVARANCFVCGVEGVYPYSELNENILPKLSVGDEVNVLSLDMLSKETQPPNRYSQGSLIKLMEDNNLGTKSTRPSIIQNFIQEGILVGIRVLSPAKLLLQ